jgi:hypothetical protein
MGKMHLDMRQFRTRKKPPDYGLESVSGNVGLPLPDHAHDTMQQTVREALIKSVRADV